MKVLWVLLGGSAGLLIGAVVGFLAALGVASLSSPRMDGSFGMREMLVCLPLGTILGGVAGIAWALRT